MASTDLDALSEFDLTTPSLRRNATARLIANGSRTVIGLVTATITARALGPSGKGTLSTLLFITVVLSYVCSMGLGHSSVVLAGRQRASRSELLAVSLAPTLVASVLGVAALWLVAWVADWRGIAPAVTVASGLVVVSTVSYLLGFFHLSLERLVWTSVVAVVQLAVDLAGLVLFVVVLDLGVLGGVLASFIAVTTSAGLLWISLGSKGFSFVPRWDAELLRKAILMGILLEASVVLGALAQRVDLVLVYSLVDEAAAGRYAVALTLGQLSGYAAGALVTAVFPRLANFEPTEAAALTLRASRTSLALVLLSGILLAPAIPILVPMMFGGEFSDAIGPALLLLLGAVPFSVQGVLTRAAAALGSPSIPFLSYGTTLVTMILLDFLLIPWAGTIGAAAASVAASASGLAICLLWFRRRFPGTLRDLLPRQGDFVEVISFLGHLLKRAYRSGARSSGRTD